MSTPDEKLAQTAKDIARCDPETFYVADAIIRAAHEYAEAELEEAGRKYDEWRDTVQAALKAERADRETAEAAVAQLKDEFLEQAESWRALKAENERIKAAANGAAVYLGDLARVGHLKQARRHERALRAALAPVPATKEPNDGK